MPFPAIDTIDTYGGVFSDGEPVVDPTTDCGATPFIAMSASVAAMTNTCPLAWFRFSAGPSPILMPTNSNGAAWGSAPAVRPLVSYGGTGIYDVQFPVTIVDGTGATQIVNLRRARAECEGSVRCGAQTLVNSANTIRIWTFNAAGTLNDITGVTVYVEVG